MKVWRGLGGDAESTLVEMRDEGILDQGRSSEDGEKGVDSRVSRKQWL